MWIFLIIAIMKWLEARSCENQNAKEEPVTVQNEQIYKRSARAVLPQDPAEYDSFARCLAELRSRFDGRGMRSSVRRDAKRQSLAVMSTRAMAPCAYSDYGVRTAVSDRFRTGELDGMRYMTSADFVRYYKEHRRNSRPDADMRSMAVSYEGRGNIPTPKKKKPLLAPATRESRQFVGRIASRLPASVREKHPAVERRAAEVHTWITADRITTDPSAPKKRFPVSVASAILVMLISLTLVVGGTVMYSDANAQYRAAASQLEALKTEENNLEQELLSSLDLVEIESYARNSLGMVDRAYAGGTYLDSTKEESIEVYPEEKSSFGLSTLLSALGFGR